MFFENCPKCSNLNLLKVFSAVKKGIMCTIFYSVNPVKIYVYEEGLVRFATVVSRKKTLFKTLICSLIFRTGAPFTVAFYRYYCVTA
jgi:hypothetical protein